MNVIAMLRSRRAEKVLGIEELAVRLAKGESVPPDEVEAVVTRCGASLDELEDAVACHERRMELKATAAGEARARAAIEAIEKKRKPLADAAEAAEAKLRAFDAESAQLVAAHEGVVRAAWYANAQLITERNLRPAAYQALREAQDAYSAADRAATAAERAANDADRALREAEDVLEYNAEKADRSLPEHVEALAQSRTTVETRRRRLGELKAAAIQASQAAQHARDAVRIAEDAARKS